jgi:nitrite reductase (NADH) large subunit
MDALVATYRCEWTEVVNDPEKRAAFRHFANSDEGDPTIELVPERGQLRPVDWPAPPAAAPKLRLPIADRRWVPLASAANVPKEGGIAVKYGDAQLAIFNFASRGAWYATQNMCPHRKDMVLARGLIGDQSGTPKVACPLHKKTFALDSGQCLSGDGYAIATFPVKVEQGLVYVELPPAQQLETALCAHAADHEHAGAVDAAE